MIGKRIKISVGTLVTSVFLVLCYFLHAYADTMSKDIALKTLEALVKGKETQPYLSTDHVMQELGSVEVIKGRGETLKVLNKYRTAFPDLTIKARRIFVAEPLVFIQGVIQGTHLGEFGKAKPTNKQYSADMLYAAWIQDQQVIRSTLYLAPDALLYQIQEGHQIKIAPPESPVQVKSIKDIKLTKSMVSQVYGALGFVLAARLASWQGNQEWVKDSFGEMEIKKMKEEYGKIKPYTKVVPDIRIKMDKIYVAGNYIIVWMSAQGTYQKKLGVTTPDKRKISVNAVLFGKVTGKEITQVQVYLDGNRLLEQII